MIRFTVYGPPVAKARHAGHGTRAHTPKKTRAYEEQVAEEAKLAMMGKEMLCGPLVLKVMFHVKRPKRANRWRPDVRPDLSNYVKSIEDGMNNVVFVDDAQICRIEASKLYSTGTLDCAEVEIDEIPA